MRALLLAAFAAAQLPTFAIAQSTVWVPLLPLTQAPQPTVRRSPAMSYDSVRDRIVMVAGRINNMGSNVYPQETWEFDGFSWLLRGQIGPIAWGGYSDTTNVAACYDSQRQVTVAIESLPQGPTNFYEWNGQNWSLALSVPASTLPWRFDFKVAYDAARGAVVLFGGYDSANFYGDTWEWNGTNLQLRSTTGPAPRWGHAMAWDQARGRVVLHGGLGSQVYGDMWDWNGAVWQPTPNGAGPGLRKFHSLVYDRSRSRLVLIGDGSTQFSDDTWEWQPSSGWQMMPPTQLARSNMAAVYDDARSRVVMYGGSGSMLPLAPSATFGYGIASAVASISSYGAGCAGPSGVVVLQTTDRPVLGATLDVQFSNVPTGILNLVLAWVGFDNTIWNGVPLPAALDPLFPGCHAYLAPVIAYSLGAAPTGTKTWELYIPFVPAIDGASFYLQGGVLTLGFNPGGVVFTNALGGTVGL